MLKLFVWNDNFLEIVWRSSRNQRKKSLNDRINLLIFYIIKSFLYNTSSKWKFNEVRTNEREVSLSPREEINCLQDYASTLATTNFSMWCILGKMLRIGHAIHKDSLLNIWIQWSIIYFQPCNKFQSFMINF